MEWTIRQRKNKKITLLRNISLKQKTINTNLAKTIENRKRDCAWGCARGINTTWENLQIAKQRASCSRRAPCQTGRAYSSFGRRNTSRLQTFTMEQILSQYVDLSLLHWVKVDRKEPSALIHDEHSRECTMFHFGILRCPETLFISHENANFLFSAFRVVQGEAKTPKIMGCCRANFAFLHTLKIGTFRGKWTLEWVIKTSHFVLLALNF